MYNLYKNRAFLKIFAWFFEIFFKIFKNFRKLSGFFAILCGSRIGYLRVHLTGLLRVAVTLGRGRLAVPVCFCGRAMHAPTQKNVKFLRRGDHWSSVLFRLYFALRANTVRPYGCIVNLYYNYTR